MFSQYSFSSRIDYWASSLFPFRDFWNSQEKSISDLNMFFCKNQNRLDGTFDKRSTKTHKNKEYKRKKRSGR